MKRCIICKKEIIEFGEKHFTDFQSIFPRKNSTKPATLFCEMGAAVRITHLRRKVKRAVSGTCV